MTLAYPIRIFDYATIVNVVDGDTCDIVMDLGFSVKMKQRFRLARIDTPEVGQPGYQSAKEFLASFVNKPVVVHVAKIDKYGRYLAEIYEPSTLQGLSINQVMLNSGLAKLYV